MKKPFPFILAAALFFSGKLSAQTDPDLYVKDAIKENRAQQYRNIVRNIINKNLALPLTDSAEEYWHDAFYALELTHYKSLWVDGRVKLAFDSAGKRTPAFQRSLLELAYSNYKTEFVKKAEELMRTTRDPRVFSMAAEYYIASGTDPKAWDKVVTYFSKRPDKDDNVPYYYGLLTGLISGYSDKKDIPSFINNLKKIVPGQVLLISFQRKNRNYPGIAVVRDRNGNFINDENGEIFSVPQLGRSINNLPFYLTSGNTPQGLFRMNGFDVSKSMAIGPTTNIQLLMPYETSPRYFLNDPSIEDSVWTEDQYKKLIPESLKEYLPLYESFYASKAGRTEIIAHGTTVNTEYYKGQPYYPYTPTEGCLCTKEIWSGVDGRRLESDQQKLVNALKAAGGANGYALVVELDDKQQPVSAEEVLAYIKASKEIILPSYLYGMATVPLAERMRPTTLDELIGQEHLTGKGSILRTAIEQGKLPSLILWGPPGVGKTTIANIIAHTLKVPFYTLSAISSGVKEVREVIEEAKTKTGVILFIDEIHRFNKGQQDALLGAVEKGIITLIGATTENPSFEVNSALLSRCQVYVLKPLGKEELSALLMDALKKDEILGKKNIQLEETGALITISGGDARKLLNLLELVTDTIGNKGKITDDMVMEIAQQRIALYDKKGEQHYDIISAFIKSMRGSDPNGAVYWLARMIEGGEDVKFIARRMLIFSSEDIGNANPNALLLATATFQAVNMIGYPESQLILSQCAIYLAGSVKSNSATTAIGAALNAVKEGDLPVPLHIRNAPTRLMKEMNYGKGYKYAHQFDDNFALQEYLPDKFKGTAFYTPGKNAEEIRKFLKDRWKDKYGY